MSTCWRIKRLLLGRFLATKPAVPTLKLSSTSSSIVACFDYTPPGPYNADDCFELQLLPTQRELVEALGDALDWCTFYSGPAREHVVDRMPAERSFRARLRAVNARGASTWTEEQPVATRQVPTLCGGTGPGYSWDQTPESVELTVRLPAGAAARDVRVEVKPTRLRVTLRGAVLVEGRTGGEVRAADEGDWEWELVDGVLLVTLAKRRVSYSPEEQWCCLLEGACHPQIDTQRMSWARPRPWRPPQDARTLEEVKQALPGNVVMDRAVGSVPASKGADDEWGGQWTKR